MIKISTFTCSILKLYGVLIMKQIIKEMYVFMHIIGRILEENLIFIFTARSNAQIGEADSSLILIRMVVHMNINVLAAMVGKNKNTIQRTINLIHANMQNNVQNLIVLIIMVKQIKDNIYLNGLRFFPKQELLTFLPIIICLI